MEESEGMICQSNEELIERYGSMVYRLILQHTHNEADAQDILQDTFIKIMKRRPIFPSIAKEKAWVLKVAMNTCKDRWKYERIRKHEQLFDQYASNTKPTETFVILPYVKKLPQKYRDVIYLFYYEGYSVKEIAELIDKKEATVLTQLKRARKRLQDMLKGEDLDAEI